MQICGGSPLEEIVSRMGLNKYTTTEDLVCSSPRGIADNLVCDADIAGVTTPAAYLEEWLHKCSPEHHLVHQVEKIFTTVRGGYACAVQCHGAVYIFRDPVGLKPLYYRGRSFASEKKGFCCTPHQLRPGELVKLPDRSLLHHRIKEVCTTDPEAVLDALTKSVHHHDNAAVLFSGGIDSSILAALTDVPLVTCGVADSQDMLFSRKAARLLKKEHIQVVISEKDIREAVPQVLSSIEEKTLMNLELGLLLFFICKAVDTPVLISGQGADELFGGYYKYEKAYYEKNDVTSMMRRDFDTITSGLERDRQIAEQFTTTVHYPYLAYPVVERALGIPVHRHFIPQRKAFLQNVGHLLKLPDTIVFRPKKALQYGSGIHKIVKKIESVRPV
jgi:asparagine synthase (glutamine-hydrolysing)